MDNNQVDTEVQSGGLWDEEPDSFEPQEPLEPWPEIGGEAQAEPAETSQGPQDDVAKRLEELERSSKYFQSKYHETLQQVQQMQAGSSGQPLVNQQQGTGVSQPAESQESLKKPVRPQRPSNYDPIDATTDPDSQSWSYRESMERYQEDLAIYLEGLQGSYQQSIEQERARREQEIQIQQINSYIRNTYQADESTLRDFYTVMNNPDTLSIDNLWRFYNMVKGPTPEQQQRRRKAEQVAARGQRPKMPIPPAVSPMTSQQDPHDIFVGGNAVEDPVF